MNVDVFISHHTASSLHIVEAIANKLESFGVRCWYAPRDTSSSYASSITQAISKCSVFLLILNKPSSESVHVLNEIDFVTKRLTKKEPVNIIPFHVADEEISPDAQYYLGRLHWIDAMTPPMYLRIDELVDRLLTLLGKEDSQNADPATVRQEYRLCPRIPQVRDIFIGREDLFAAISQSFDAGNRVLFLEGIGGIGKSELAKQYAITHPERFDQVLFMTYVSNLQELVCDPNTIEIQGLEQQQDESAAAFFQRKIRVFRTLVNERTLLIVDNFDTDTDPDLDVFLEGSHKVIFTTRNAHSGFASLLVKAIPDKEALFQVFQQNYGMPVEAEDRPYLEKLFSLIEYHTYTIELLAKQMQASFLTGREMLELFVNGRLASGATETFQGRRSSNTAFGHICSVFSTSNLSGEEQQILRELSLMGLRGVPANRFREWANLPSFETVNRLIRRSWIRRETGQRLSLHPLVREVVHEVLKPTEENCADFLHRLSYFAYNAWYHPLEENLAVSDCIMALMDYFAPFRADSRDSIWIMLPNFLWQVMEYDKSIYYGRIVYETYLQKLGEASMATGFAAKSLGGCYFNSGYLKESIPYFKQALKSMLLSGEPEGEDLAMAYEKVARCYTWEYERDFDKAEELFQRCLEIRLAMRKQAEQGTIFYDFNHRADFDVKKIDERIGEAYMEMGRMYQAMGDYQTAWDYTDKQEQIFLRSGSSNASGFAYIHYDKGVCHYHMGKKAQAEGDLQAAARQYEKALVLLSDALGSNLKMRGELAWDTIDNQEYLADTYAAMGNYGAASNYYMAVASSVERLGGKDHPRLLSVREKMCFSTDR